jgi:predicted Zn-dependent protease
MKIAHRRRFRFALAAAFSLAAGSCAYNEQLGRNQLLFVSSDQMAQLGLSAWSDVKKQQAISTDPRYVNRVRRVMPKIVGAAGEDPAQWEVEVFQSKDLNAFALPGGKIGFNTALLDIMQNDAQIATVMGHEVAHVVYNHSGERYSQSALAQAGMSVAQAATSGSANQNAVLGILGAGASVGVILPFSRKHELEADKFGVRYMAQAGYDPNEALRFWEKMSASNKGAPPEFLSTHPSDATRIEQLRQEIALLTQGS